MPMGVSGQAKPLLVSVIGGSALLPAASRCAGDATTIGPVTAGWHTGLSVWARMISGKIEAASRPTVASARKSMGHSSNLNLNRAGRGQRPYTDSSPAPRLVGTQEAVECCCRRGQYLAPA